MASHRALGAISATIAGLIRDRYPRGDFGTALTVDIYQTRNFEAPMTDGFSVFLYRTAVNGTIRNLHLRRTSEGRVFRPSLPLDLYYMITPWAEDAERHDRMLGWVMRMIEDLGVLGSAHLNHYIAETDTFAPAETVDIVAEPLALNDYFTIWDRFPKLPTSATYVLRMVRVDSDVEVGEGPPVQARTFAFTGDVPAGLGGGAP